jgi:hypothetical protein
MFFIISLLSLTFQAAALFITHNRIHLESPIPHIPPIPGTHPLLILSWRQLVGTIIVNILITQALLLIAILCSLFYHKFAASIIYTDRVIPLLAILFDFLALLAGIALCWFCYGL